MSCLFVHIRIGKEALDPDLPVDQDDTLEKKGAVSEAQLVFATLSDRTSKNGSNEYYTCLNRLLAEIELR
jgi:hypothetical protein